MINHHVGCGERSEPHRWVDVAVQVVRFTTLTTPCAQLRGALSYSSFRRMPESMLIDPLVSGMRRNDGLLISQWLLRLLFIAIILFAVCARAEISVIDDAGVRLTLPAPAQRIVSLSPHITELLYAAGAGDNLIAAVAYSDYPEAARNLPRIGDATRIDLERLLILKPDLIIAWGSGSPARELEGVRRLGLPLYLSEPRRLNAIGDQLRRFGKLAGSESVAETAAADYERQLAILRARYAERPFTPVFYQLSQQPLLTVNHEHIISDVLALCGGENLFAALPAFTPHLSIESVLTAQPAAVIFALYPGESAADVEAFWRRYGLAGTTRYIGIPGDYIHRPTPRILEGVERICNGLAQ